MNEIFIYAYINKNPKLERKNYANNIAYNISRL